MVRMIGHSLVGLSRGATMGKGCRPFLLNPAACTLLRLWGESEDLWEDGEEMKEPRELANSKKKLWKSGGKHQLS